jgi:hypothetical protein
LTGARKGIMRENRYSKWDLLQSILLFILSCLCSFLENSKRTFFYLLYINNDHERLKIIFPPLYIACSYPHLVASFDKKVSPRPCNDNDQVDESRETQTNVSPTVIGPTPPKARHRYIPLKLPQTLPDFPPNYYEFLPMFDGESCIISVEKNIQGFDHFTDLFEIDHDDVCMIFFSQSLKGDTKHWFKHLCPETISSWVELKKFFFFNLGQGEILRAATH